ncbi:MAG: glycosyltransferase family 4 protein [Pseudomonadota bacterium]
MRVAIITPMLSHFEVPMYRLASTFDGLDVRVFHTDLRDDAFYDRDYGRVIDWGERLRSGYAHVAAATAGEMQRAVLDWKPHIALMYGYAWRGALGLLARLRFAKTPVVHRGLLTPYMNVRRPGWLTRPWRFVQPHLLRRFQGHHYGGTYSQAVLNAASIPASQTFFVPYSVDTAHFRACSDDPVCIRAAARLKANLGWDGDAPVVLFMCQHSAFKAPDVALLATAELQKSIPNLKLIMAGSGQMTEPLKRLAHSKLISGSFHFPGFVASKKTPTYYLAADLALFPSRYDTWSRGINESMLARRPCVVSRVVPAAGGLVDDQVTGYVVDDLTPDAFVKPVLSFFNAPGDARQRMGAHARQRAEQFSYEANATQLRASFEATYDAYSARTGAA